MSCLSQASGSNQGLILGPTDSDAGSLLCLKMGFPRSAKKEVFSQSLEREGGMRGSGDRERRKRKERKRGEGEEWRAEEGGGERRERIERRENEREGEKRAKEREF